MHPLSRDIQALANPVRAKLSLRYFKTGPGQDGEGDVFAGLTVPQVRMIAKKYRELPLSEAEQLLHSKLHEERQTVLMILVYQFRKGDETKRKKIYDLYLANTKYINNWDLIDLTAPAIIGGYLADKNRSILTKLAQSESLWERRIAMLATFQFIARNESDDALKVAELLVYDEHDLIHKAVGWGLREIGKRCGEEIEEKFLKKHAATMPRTMLRYAIERFDERKRKLYLSYKYKTA